MPHTLFRGDNRTEKASRLTLQAMIFVIQQIFIVHLEILIKFSSDSSPIHRDEHDTLVMKELKTKRGLWTPNK